jgi:ABC-type antimicrobial peptide transport system permease subunit
MVIAIFVGTDWTIATQIIGAQSSTEILGHRSGRNGRSSNSSPNDIPRRFELAVVAMLIAICIAIPLGVIAGKNRGTLTDNALSVVALVGISLPSFVIGPMLVYIFAVKLGWLAPSGRFILE